MALAPSPNQGLDRVRARRTPQTWSHAWGWCLLATVVFIQPWARVAADTKHDLTANPWGFLRGALHAYTDIFPLGQLQNQAYGYLFPQGLFFALAEPLPDWLAQRCWWLIVLGVGFSGALVLLRRLGLGTPWSRWGAALLFALSPRALSTLTAISSETWPVMLAPWVAAAFVGVLDRRAVAAGVIPVAAMGAVNATATLAACLPAGLILAWRCLRREPRAGRVLAWWLVGCALVSLWWIVPLVVLGRYAPPFTEFIESAFVTTRWLNPAEILRGTTSWAPFASSERVAGSLLVTEPIFVLATLAVAALGLIGLSRTPHRGLWLGMLLCGVAIMGAGWQVAAPLAGQYHGFLDGIGAALRNLHKFDPLVRLPLVVGLAALGPLVTRRSGALVLVALVASISMAPAWSARLLPQGTFTEVPREWREAAEFVNAHAAQTRTLILPEASFARQEWGWTRDEPAQPLLTVPWAVRDAIPLVDPEAIRGLDGLLAVLHDDPLAARAALHRMGIGALLVRHDLDTSAHSTEITVPEDLGEVHRFGEIEVVLLPEQPDMRVVSGEPVRVAGGGESLALLDSLGTAASYELVPEHAQVVTDTPALIARNYGTLHGAQSAPLASPEEGADVHNRLPDYPSAGPLTSVTEHGGRVRASSSAADASSFGGADPTRSITAAVDGNKDTAWHPAPGPARGQWLEITPERPITEATITTTEDATLSVNSQEIEAPARTPVTLRWDTPVEHLRLTLDTPTGIAEVETPEQPVERVVTVPDTSPDVQQFVFQRLLVDTGVLIREFTAPRDMRVRLEAPTEQPVLIDATEYHPGEVIDLKAGAHRLRTSQIWVRLSAGDLPSPTSQDVHGSVAPVEEKRLLVTNRAANPGLRASVGGTSLSPRAVEAGVQAFVLPAGVGGKIQMSFAGERPYRWGLAGGLVLAALTVLGSTLLLVRRGGPPVLTWQRDSQGAGLWLPCAAVATLVGGLPGLGVVAASWLVLRWSTWRAGWLIAATMSIAGAWLARAPWPSASYAGDSLFLGLCVLAALGVACAPPPRDRAARGPFHQLIARRRHRRAEHQHR
ncbi:MULTISPECIES: alpha-(1-_3)-arabinofuranosyltransferase family protein [unclassified Corynebacterium]|uniref:alpha-(1->3)-arabinofuranosyltransferase domain-containing protein n=1 Tax=unclassified Corynebacterium TaxID=2624378 RepID=UPI0029CA770E|nr:MULTISPECIES: alpha-(1->3)-arabinofuranosyltransferase family protein [unclassified Corynebacterium]WPF65992.1 alpha-(1->3)-arabinofuranosyltransferase family protein [Corynebacterium sp. 22KM0430]WPF68485.1 alpha-(1->3)-arabinofuranosyltransferase family protein [Corynebacterium sp. 21KM1197]